MTTATSGFLNRPLRSEEEARREIAERPCSHAFCLTESRTGKVCRGKCGRELAKMEGK